MNFIIVTNNDNREIWLNSLEIAAILPSKDRGGCSIILKNGQSYISTASPDEIYLVLNDQFRDQGGARYSRV
jgi:uncharacterized protein YlzI (FlbEa/FlbD family)